jgi:hypothetical protein
MKLFSITNHTPMQLRNWLVKYEKIELQDVYIHPVGLTFPEKPKKKIVVVLNLQDFYRGLSILNNKQHSDVAVFLFCAPFRAIELSGIVNLDFVQNERLKYKFDYTSINLKLYRKSLPVLSVERAEDKFLYSIIEDVSSGSLLTPLMTFLYTLPKATHQTPVKESVVNFIWNGKPVDKSLESLGISLSTSQMAKLSLILEGEGAEYRRAIKHYKVKKKENKDFQLKSLSKQFKVQDYELSYLKKINSSSARYGKNVGRTTKELAGHV